jgi:hypothetical protein
MLAIAERIGYARARWVGLGIAAELERRAGHEGRARAFADQRAQLVGALAGSLPEPEQRGRLLATGAAAAL